MPSSLVLFGLGGNLGNRAENIRLAFRLLQENPDIALEEARLSPLYASKALLPKGAPAEWGLPFLNAVAVGYSHQSSQKILQATQAIEVAMGRAAEHAHWSPRVMDIDVLACGGEVLNTGHLTLPHPHLAEREFVLRPLHDVVPHWQHPVSGAFVSDMLAALPNQGECWPFSEKTEAPKLVGILNITPDSFSDGGKYASAESALSHARQLIADGADVIDVGAESTRPAAKMVSDAEEWARLQPLLPELVRMADAAGVRVALDSYHPATVQKALKVGVQMINDVSGFANPQMVEVVKESDCALVMMHSLSVPASPAQCLPEGEDVVLALARFAHARAAELEAQGIARERLVFDPGLGFGKTAEQSLEILQRVRELSDIGLPLYIGHSRKSFLQAFSEEGTLAVARDGATLALSAMLKEVPNMAYLRVHDVATHREILGA